MRRSIGVVAVLCLVASACTGDDADDADDAAPAGEASDTSEADEAVADDPTASPVAQRPDPVDLPGLLDPSDEPVANDAAVRAGTLDNGLRYFVRFNDNPGGKAELRLAIRAGSVNETGASNGVAHFAEHMLFNGTELFPENELIDVLRSFGASFGADVNARTSFDETVYQLTVPNAEESIAVGLSVLEQWLSHASFTEEQVIAERGVVLDEWRVRTQTTSGRLVEVAQAMFLAGSAYEGRSPIGDEESIASMANAELRQFYDDWYRPDNAAIVVVGEIDVDEMVADIERLFGPAAPRSDTTPARPDIGFPLDTEPDFGLHVDPDQQTVDVEVSLPIPGESGTGTAALRSVLTDSMVYDALIRRLDLDVAAGVAPFDRVARGGNSFVHTLDAPALFASTDADRVADTLAALLDEYERAFRHGFTEAETDVVRAELRASFDARFEGRESTQDREYAEEYVDAFLFESPYPSIESLHAIGTELLDSITPESLGLRFRARWSNSAPHVLISTPEADAERMPSRAEVSALIDELSTRPIEPRKALRDLPDELIARPAPPTATAARNVADRPTTFFDPIEVVHANGVTVIVNTNPIVEGQVFFQAASPGGLSLVADADVVDALYSARVVTSGGVADYNQAELAEILAGREVSVDAWLSPYRENLGGSAATADAEQLFQLVHLYMTDPRFDPVALDQLRRRTQPLIDDPGSDPGVAGDDALRDIRYPDELRYASLPEPEQFATLDLDGVERVWTERFGDASDWVFVFSGDFEASEVLDLAAAYLGTLPSSGASEEPIDVEVPPPPGVVRAVVEAGTGDTASVSLLITAPVDDITARLRVTADVVSEVISARLSDVIREELGESYSPRASTSVTTDPDPAIETFVRVTGSPDRVEAIADLVVREFADLAADGPGEQEFLNAFAQVEEAYNFVNNGEFIAELLDDAIDPARELDDYLFEDAELSSVTSGAVREYLRELVPTDRFIQVTVLPR